MSQKKVMELLEQLGGRGTLMQLSKLAEEKYPEASLHSYVGHQLRKLQRWGDVDFDKQTKEWFIKSRVKARL